MELPEWFYEVSLSEGVFTMGAILAVLSGVTLGVVKFWKLLSPLFLDTRQFLLDWNGSPPVNDSSGAELAPAKPGIKAAVNAIQEQLENDHAPVNLRHDIDTKATKLQVEELSRGVRTLNQKLGRHIELSIEREKYEDKTLQVIQLYLPALKKLAEETSDGPLERSDGRTEE